MRKTFVLLCLFAILSAVPSRAEFYTDEEKNAVLYQVDISTRTADHIQEIYNEFNNSFIDYEPALERVNILINEYTKAVQAVTIPKGGEELHRLMKKLLSRVEKYFVFYKAAGREDPYINSQIVETMIEISRESTRLAYQYV